MKRKLETEDLEQNKKIKVEGTTGLGLEFVLEETQVFTQIFDKTIRDHIFQYLSRNDLSNLESTSTASRNLFLENYSLLFSNFTQSLETNAPKFQIDDCDNLLEPFRTLTTTNNITRIFLEDILKKYENKNPESEQIKGILLFFFSKLSISILFNAFEIDFEQNRYKFVESFPFHFKDCTFTEADGIWMEFDPSKRFPEATFDGETEFGGLELYEMSDEECYRRGIEPHYLADDNCLPHSYEYVQQRWDHVVEKMELRDEIENKANKIKKLKEEIKTKEETYKKENDSLLKIIQNLQEEIIQLKETT